MGVSDHQIVCETVYQYAYGIDTRDWVLYESIFAPEVAIDFCSYNGRPASTMAAADWVASVRPLFMGLAATQHSMSNPLVRFEPAGGGEPVGGGETEGGPEAIGDRAVCTMYIQAAHALDHGNDDRWFSIGGYYRDTLVRTAAGWRIDGVTLTVLWRRGDESIMADAVRRGRSHAGS